MAGIYDFVNLTEAIVDSSSKTISKTMAESLLQEAWRREGLSGIWNTAESYGVNIVRDSTGNFAYYYVNNLPSVTATSTVEYYNGVLDVLSADGELIASVPPATTTGTGSVVSSGGTANLIKFTPPTIPPVVAYIGAVAAGVGLGYVSYKKYPTFWNDISEAVFNDEFGDTLVVLNKAVDGKYTSFVNRPRLEQVVLEMAHRGTFNYTGGVSEFTDDMPAGVYDTTFNGIALSSTSGYEAYNKLATMYSDFTVIQENITEFKKDTTRLQSSTIYAVRGIDRQFLPTSHSVAKTEKASGGYAFSTVVNGVPLGIQFLVCGATVYKDGGVRTTTPYTANAVTVYSGYNTAVLSTEDADFTYVGGLNAEVKEEKGDYPIFPVLPFVPSLNLSKTATIDDVRNELKDKFPSWYDNNINVPTYNPDTNEVVNVPYIPLGFPNVTDDPATNQDPNTVDKPDNYTQDQAQTGEITEDNTVNIVDNEIVPDTITPVPFVPSPDTPDTGGGATTGGSNNLYAVYNPTKVEINGVGAYLWSSNVLDIISKFFSNPMDSIISLHMVYCTPNRGDRKNIVLGYLDTGVSAITVPNQFTNIDCGNVVVDEYFNDARDYSSAYTNIDCYLPFIGIVHLKTEDIVGSTVNIKYTVDVFTGALVCKIFVTKLGSKQLLYTYSGNCSVQIPLTGADRTRLLSGIISGATTGFAMGGGYGALAGALVGSTGYLGGASIERSGGFSSNAGAMSVKYPYLIITRKAPYDAGNYNKYYGFPSNITASLGSCSGYTKVKEVHVDISGATVLEKTEIENLLKSGVIVK